MDIQHMVYFVEVVKQGSMTKASEKLFIAQPTISKTIKNLEDELQLILFDRSKKSLKLTDAGKIFFEQCNEIVNLYKDLPVVMDNLLGVKTGHLKIGLSPIMNVKKLIKILADFHNCYPNITYELIENGGKTIEQSIRIDELDVGITALPVDDRLFQSFPFYEEELKLVVNKNHPLADKEKVSLIQLENEGFILFNENFYLNDIITDSCKRAGFIPHIVSKISQWNSIEQMIIAQIGIGILPKSIIEMLSDDVRSVSIESPSIVWQLGVIWKNNKYMNFVTKEWLHFMQKQLDSK